jgi:hypothetical protein
VEGSCEHGIEPSGSIKCWEVLEGLHNCGCSRKGSAPWISKGKPIPVTGRDAHRVVVLNPSIRTMALGSTQPLTEMSTRNLSECKKRPGHRADNLAAICEPNALKLWDPRPLAHLRVSTACTWMILPFYTLLDFPIKFSCVLCKKELR